VDAINELDVLRRALNIAAEMLAEHSQLYDEVATPEAWVSELIARARITSLSAEKIHAFMA